MERSYHFIRHGQAVYQARGFDAAAYPPDVDWPLTAHGEGQARRLGARLRALGVGCVVSSELARARQTATLAAAASSLPYVAAWPELDELEPWRLRRLRRTPARWRLPGWLEATLGAVAVLQHRRGRGARSAHDVTSVLEDIDAVLTRLDQQPEPRVAVVGHGYWILLMALTLSGERRLRAVRNASITTVQADGAGRRHLTRFAAPLDG